MSTVSRAKGGRGPRAPSSQAPNDLNRGRPRGRNNTSNRAPGDARQRSATHHRNSSSSRPSRRRDDDPLPSVEEGETGSAGLLPTKPKPTDDLQEYFALLKKNREAERAHAIANNLVDDPDKQRRLEDAITFVGTCQDKCPEFERVERIVRRAVDRSEKVIGPDGTEVVSHEHMVKRFRRSAAGDEAQLPSDVRPPLILKKTLHYLIDEVVGGGQSLAKVHAFVWDRTRSIRNDFTLQNVEGFKNEDLQLAIYCYEIIARFHIHALHELSNPDIDDHGFSAHNEIEQLNKTLLSLMEFYDLGPSRRLKCANEAEFRGYMILMHIYNQDVERKAQNIALKRPDLFEHPRYQLALELYRAAGNTHDLHGPLRPPRSVPIAQNQFAKFFEVIKSNRVSYTMACMAEIHFNHVRKDALEAIRAAYRARATSENATPQLLVNLLGFDTEEEAQAFAQACGIEVDIGRDGLNYLMLNQSVGQLVDPNDTLKQPFSSSVVEQKRHGRTLPEVVHGAQPPLDGKQSDHVTGTSTASKNPNPFAVTSSPPPIPTPVPAPAPALRTIPHSTWSQLTLPLGPYPHEPPPVAPNGSGGFGKPSTLEPMANNPSPSTKAQEGASTVQQQPLPSFTPPGLHGSSPSSRLGSFGSFGKPSSMLTSTANKSPFSSIKSTQETSKVVGAIGKPSSMSIPDGDQALPLTQASEGPSNGIVESIEDPSTSMADRDISPIISQAPKRSPLSSDVQPQRSCFKAKTDGSPSPVNAVNESSKKAVHFKEGHEESLFISGFSDDEQEPSGQSLKPLPSMATPSSVLTGLNPQASTFTPTFKFANQPSTPTATTGQTLASTTTFKFANQSSTSTASTADTSSKTPVLSQAQQSSVLNGTATAGVGPSPLSPRRQSNQAASQSTSSTTPVHAAASTFSFLQQTPSQTTVQSTPSTASKAPTPFTSIIPSSTEVSNEASGPSSLMLGNYQVSAAPSNPALSSTPNDTSLSLPGPTPSVAEPSSFDPQPPSSSPQTTSTALPISTPQPTTTATPKVAEVQPQTTTDTVPSSPPKEPEPDEISAEMVSWLFSDDGGLMDQLIDFVLPDILDEENDVRVADDFRQHKLMTTYARRWRRIAEKGSMIRHGKRKRERMNQWLKESREKKKWRESHPEVDPLLQSYREKYGLGEFNNKSPAQISAQGGKGKQPSAIQAETETETDRRRRRSKRKSDSDLESLLDTTNRAKRNKRAPDAQPTSSVTGTSPSGSSGLDASGRYPHANSSMRRKSHASALPGGFLPGVSSLFSGRTIMGSPLSLAPASGTVSDVWRLKAAGLVTLPNGVTQPINMPPSPPKSKKSKKRSLETDNDDDVVEVRASKSQKRSVNPSSSASNKSVPTINNTSSTSSAPKEAADKSTADGGEDLHAQVQNLLARMDEGIDWYREEMEKEKQRQEQSQRSSGSSGINSQRQSISSSGRGNGSGPVGQAVAANRNATTTTPKSYTAGHWWSRVGGIDLSIGPKSVSGLGSSIGNSSLVRPSFPEQKPTPPSVLRARLSRSLAAAAATSTTPPPPPPPLASASSTKRSPSSRLRRMLGYDRRLASSPT